MFDLLEKKIKEKISITDDEFDYCKSLFIEKKLKRKKYLMQEGDVCRYTAFVHTGLMRSAGIVALLIALITVSLQATKAAISNPVKSLRTE